MVARIGATATAAEQSVEAKQAQSVEKVKHRNGERICSLHTRTMWVSLFGTVSRGRYWAAVHCASPYIGTHVVEHPIPAGLFGEEAGDGGVSDGCFACLKGVARSRDSVMSVHTAFNPFERPCLAPSAALHRISVCG